jgi:hypothetical protein
MGILRRNNKMVKVFNFGGVNEGASRVNMTGTRGRTTTSVVINGQVRTFASNALPKGVRDAMKAYQEGKRKVAV